MPNRSLLKSRIEDPYRLLAVKMLEEAFRTIGCYFTRIGTEEEIKEGRDSIRWMRRMEGNFRIIAIASGKSLDNFHQMCMSKINDIRQEAIKQNEITRLGKENQQSPLCGTANSQVD